MTVLDITGKTIKEYDVCRAIATDEMMIVLKNKKGKLIVKNSIIGLSDFLDVYPNGELQVVGNAAVSFT